MRDDHDRKTASMVGIRIHDVEYWDLHNFGNEPREWDYGDWHHAVMGVELQTASGPISVLWTNTFYPYGVEVFTQPMTTFLRLSDDGPERWSVTDHREWQARAGQPVTAVETLWERLDLGPASDSNGRIVEPARTVDLPVALRLDFPAGPVWLVAGIPTEDGTVSTTGDEIVVAFTTEAMLRFGFPASNFTRR